MADQSVEEQNVDNDVVESGKDNGIVDTVKDDGGQEVADNQLKNKGEGKSPGTDWKAEAVSGSLVLKVILPSWRSFVHRVTILDLLLMSFAARMRNSKTGSTGLFLRV